MKGFTEVLLIVANILCACSCSKDVKSFASALNESFQERILVKASENIHYSGSDVTIIKELSSKLNFKVEFTNSTSRADIEIGFHLLSDKLMGLMENTVSYDFCQLIIVVPPGQKISSLQKLFLAFDKKVWFFTCSVFILALISSYAMNTQSLEIRKFIFGHDGYLSCMTIIGGILSTSSQPLRSKRHFCRILWMIFLLFGIIMRSLHQATLFKLLQNDDYENGLSSIDEIIKENATIYVHEKYRNLIAEDDRGITFKIMKKFNFKALIDNENLFLMPSVEVLYYSQKYSRQFKVIKESLYSIPVVFYASKELLHLIAAIDEKIGEFLSAGLIQFWTYKMNIKNDNFISPSTLTLDHLSIAFKIHMLGCFISLIAFIIEKVYVLFGHKKSTNNERIIKLRSKSYP